MDVNHNGVGEEEEVIRLQIDDEHFLVVKDICENVLTQLIPSDDHISSFGSDCLWRIVEGCLLKAYMDIPTVGDGAVVSPFVLVKLFSEFFHNNLALYTWFMNFVNKKGERQGLADNAKLVVSNGQRGNKTIQLVRRTALDMVGSFIPEKLKGKPLHGSRKKASPITEETVLHLKRVFRDYDASKWKRGQIRKNLTFIKGLDDFKHLSDNQLKTQFRKFVAESVLCRTVGASFRDATLQMALDGSYFLTNVVIPILVSVQKEMSSVNPINGMPNKLNKFILRCAAHESFPLNPADIERVASFAFFIQKCFLVNCANLWNDFAIMQTITNNHMGGNPHLVIAKFTLNLDSKLRDTIPDRSSGLYKCFTENTFIKEAVVDELAGDLYPDIKEFEPTDESIDTFNWPMEFITKAVLGNNKLELIARLLQTFLLKLMEGYKRHLMINNVNALADETVFDVSGNYLVAESSFYNDEKLGTDDGGVFEDDTGACDLDTEGIGDIRTSSGLISSLSSDAIGPAAVKQFSSLTGSIMLKTAASKHNITSLMQGILYKIGGAAVNATVGVLEGRVGMTGRSKQLIDALLGRLTISKEESEKLCLPVAAINSCDYRAGVLRRPSLELFECILTLEVEVVTPVLNNQRLLAVVLSDFLNYFLQLVKCRPVHSRVLAMIREAIAEVPSCAQTIPRSAGSGHLSSSSSSSSSSNSNRSSSSSSGSGSSEGSETATKVATPGAGVDDDESLAYELREKFFSYYCGASAADCVLKIVENKQYLKLKNKMSFRAQILNGIKESVNTDLT